ncbi:endo alpha-1,4 polygalactosaminidase [Streptomyces sp. ASQP_92]|uniref:endo alpha-1,4 polygalactosaminidase n=1 Tax=Streptomyces sp. ASQP_92 TaxID=2979116 RepID=UPI0021BF80C2|nr:endo alpha-1,4 polygalactosaminidase [Streptomyces sp. ASQP_92]MCT9092407.1 endo alpha-1,4 polygalactosaminidase [Streptomyces sp. ASQP_92]
MNRIPSRRPAALLCTAVTLLLLATACSSDSSDDDADGPDQPRPTTTAPTPSTAPTPGGKPTPPSASSSPAPAPSGSAPARIWQPKPGTAWQWQLNGRVQEGPDVPVYDIDGFENTAADVAKLHAKGRKAICYINAGAWENFRPDKEAFPSDVRGENNGWEGERWLDIRRMDVLRPLMERRFDMCRQKGFDAVEPDLMDGYLNKTGFPLKAADQLAYNRMLSSIAHARGLAVGLKNDLQQIPDLVPAFDFAVNEQCAQYDECAQLSPFVRADKAVFHVEYELPAEDFCAESNRLGLSSMRKNLKLDVWRQPC